MAESQVFLNPLLQLARRAHLHGKSVLPYLQHHPRIVGPLSFLAVGLVEAPQILALDHFVNQKTQMLLRQLVTHLTGQQLGLLGRIRKVVRHSSAFADFSLLHKSKVATHSLQGRVSCLDSVWALALAGAFRRQRTFPPAVKNCSRFETGPGRVTEVTCPFPNPTAKIRFSIA